MHSEALHGAHSHNIENWQAPETGPGGRDNQQDDPEQPQET